MAKWQLSRYSRNLSNQSKVALQASPDANWYRLLMQWGIVSQLWHKRPALNLLYERKILSGNHAAKDERQDKSYKRVSQTRYEHRHRRAVVDFFSQPYPRDNCNGKKCEVEEQA
jgi:hypothetical protein